MNLLFLHPGPQVSFRLCPVPPKFERCQAVNVLITRMVDLPHKRSFVCICNQLLDSNKIKTNFIICVIQVGHPRAPRGPGAGGAGVPPEPRGHLGAGPLYIPSLHTVPCSCLQPLSRNNNTCFHPRRPLHPRRVLQPGNPPESRAQQSRGCNATSVNQQSDMLRRHVATGRVVSVLLNMNSNEFLSSMQAISAEVGGVTSALFVGGALAVRILSNHDLAPG